MKFFKDSHLLMLMLASLAILPACGSDSSSDSPGSSTITGSVFASSVSGAEVTVYDTDGNIVAKPVTTDTDGNYSVSVSGSGDLVFESKGGRFTDEATGIEGVTAGTLAAYVSAGTLGSAVHLTPASTIIREMVQTHAMTMTEAETAFQTAFAYTPDISIKPVDITLANATTFPVEQRLEGLRAATFSQLSIELGAVNPDIQFRMLGAIARDLSDNVLDGSDGIDDVSYLGGGSIVTLPEDMKRCFVNALLKFQADGNDLSGLTAADLGALPFSNIAFTNVSGYRVEYIEGMMSPTTGRATFTLNITDASDNPVTGLTPMIMPMMYMNGMKHGSPVESVVDNGDGSYTCTIYYSMGSTMMDGTSMGFWELKVMVAMNETTYFYPTVAMDMSKRPATLVGGADDLIAAMVMDGMMHGSDPVQRSYKIYNNGFSGMSGMYSMELFVAAEDSNMMTYVPLTTDVQLVDETDTVWPVSSVSVRVSANNGSTWSAPTTPVTTDNGRLTFSGLNLMDGMTYNLQVELTVNGVIKNTTGGDPFATLVVTPGGGGMAM